MPLCLSNRPSWHPDYSRQKIRTVRIPFAMDSKELFCLPLWPWEVKHIEIYLDKNIGYS